VLGIVCGVLLIYAHRLDVAPPALLPDEAAAIRHAESIAQAGRDLDGRRFPLFVHLHDNVWTQPLPVYFTALLGPVVGSSDAAVRMPSVIVAALDAALIYLSIAGGGSISRAAVLRRTQVRDPVTVITLGVQIIFSSFFLSVLGLGRK
jgi:hypothetical protein